MGWGFQTTAAFFVQIVLQDMNLFSCTLGSLSIHPSTICPSIHPLTLLFVFEFFFANHISDKIYSFLFLKINVILTLQHAEKYPNLEVHLGEFSQSLYPYHLHYIKKQNIASPWGSPHPPTRPSLHTPPKAATILFSKYRD